MLIKYYSVNDIHFHINKKEYEVWDMDINIPLEKWYFILISIVRTITEVLIFPLFAHLPTPYALAAPSLWPSPHCHLCLWVMHICSLTNPFRRVLIVQCVYDISGSLICIINQFQCNVIKEKASQLTLEQCWEVD